MSGMVRCAYENNQASYKPTVVRSQNENNNYGSLTTSRHTRGQSDEQKSEEASPLEIALMMNMMNRDRILNTVLAQLQSRAEGRNDNPLTNIWEKYAIPVGDFHDDGDNPDVQEGAMAEYGVNWERGARQIGRKKYYSICRTQRTTVTLKDNEYEYRPAHYEEIRCISNRDYSENRDRTMCASFGFECIQWNETIHITRRKFNSGCWESFTQVIPNGCECMWPEHRLGKIEMHQA